MQLSLTLEELWTLQHLVRHGQGPPDYGVVWDRDDMRLIHHGLLALDGKPPEDEYRLECTEGLLWQIEAQVPQSLDLGRSNRGRTILLKVMKLLNEEAESVLTPVPEIFWGAMFSDPVNDPNDYADEDY